MPAIAEVLPQRCGNMSERRALMERAFALGVPRNHGRVRKLRMQREPARLVSIGTDIHGRIQWLQPRAARALARMREAALGDGVELQIVSAFRSIEYQLGIIERKLARGLGMDEILRVSAAPGYSEHHTGRCVDFTTPGFKSLEEEFERSPAFRWLRRNATGYGFALSYPRGNVHGIAYEPWHWCWHAPISHQFRSSFRGRPQPHRGRNPESSAFAFDDKDTGLLAPSLALALRAACGVRVCNPANAVPLSRE